MASNYTDKDRPVNNEDTEVTVDDVIVVPESPHEQSVTDDVGQISKNIAIGRKEAYYEDGRNS